MEGKPIVVGTLETVMGRIGYGKYQLIAFITTLLIMYAWGVEIIVLGIYEKYLINESEFSDITISLICTTMNLGMTLGFLVSLILSSWLGRLRIMQISIVTILVSVAASSFIIESILFCVFRTLTNFGLGLGIMIVYTYLVECSPRNNRGFSSAYVDISYGLGEILTLRFAFIFMREIDGENVSIVFLLPYIFLVIPLYHLFFYLKESPWYLSNLGRNEELCDTLNFISVENTGFGLSQEEIEKIKRMRLKDEIGLCEVLGKMAEKHNAITIVQLTVIKIVFQVGYIGGLFVVPFLFNSDMYYLIFLIAIISTLPFAVGIFFIIEHKAFARKNTLLLSMALLMMLSISMIFTHNNEITTGIILGCLGGLASVSDTVSAVYMVEFFDTDLRVICGSIIQFITRLQIFYFVIILVAIVHHPIALYSFFAITFFVGMLTIMTIKHDTRGKELDSEYTN